MYISRRLWPACSDGWDLLFFLQLLLLLHLLFLLIQVTVQFMLFFIINSFICLILGLIRSVSCCFIILALILLLLLIFILFRFLLLLSLRFYIVYSILIGRPNKILLHVEYTPSIVH